MNIHPVILFDLTPDTAYLAGAIIGDGHILAGTKSKEDRAFNYRISLELGDEEYANNLLILFKRLIGTKASVKTVVRQGRNPTYSLMICNKILYHFYAYDLLIPTGKKSSIVTVPAAVKTGSKLIKAAFLAGLFDTDGGTRGKTIGWTSASYYLMRHVQELLLDFGITATFEHWKNRRYNRLYFGLKIHRKHIDTFINEIPALTNKCTRR